MRKILIVLTLLMSMTAFCYAEIRIGTLFATSGRASFLGMPEKQTVDMLAEAYNKAGGLNGEKIKVYHYDTQGQAERARKGFLRHVKKNRVDLIIGPSTSGNTLAIKELASKFKIPVISCAASKRIVDPMNKFVFKTPQSDDHVAEKLIELIISEGKKKVAIMSIQNGYGQSGRAAFLDTAKKYPVTVVADEKFNASDRDMKAQLTKINSAGAEAIIVWGAGSTPALVAKNAHELGLNNIYMTQGAASNKFIELAGQAAEGIKLTAGRLMIADQLDDSSPYKKVIIDYVKEFKAYANSQVSAFGGHAYDAMTMLKLAYKKGLKGMALINAIEKVSFYGTAGKFQFTADDHNGLTKDAFVIVEIKGGKFVLSK